MIFRQTVFVTSFQCVSHLNHVTSQCCEKQNHGDQGHSADSLPLAKHTTSPQMTLQLLSTLLFQRIGTLHYSPHTSGYNMKETQLIITIE